MSVIRMIKDLINSTSVKRGHSQTTKGVDKICVVDRHVLAHCHLLECFVNVHRHVVQWAIQQRTLPQTMWRFYINMAVQRFIRWLEVSYSTDTSQVIPPVDVLLVWHAFLQNPRQWDEFVTQTRIDFAQWNQDELYLAVTQDDGVFSPSFQSHDMIRTIFEAPVLLNTLHVSASFLVSSRPDHTTDRLWECFLRDDENFSINTPDGVVPFSFDVHKAVRQQLQFATFQVLPFSWHRMQDPQDLQFAPFIQRYLNFMGLIRSYGTVGQLSTDGSVIPASPIPNLDMDLVWRTHMLFPNDYRWLCDGVNGGILPHIPSTNEIHHMTSGMYQHALHREYGICLCWPCVANRATPAQGFSPLRWRKGKAAREKPSVRDTSVAGVSLAFTSKQCHECGSHPERDCREKAVAKIAMSQYHRQHQHQHQPTESVDDESVSSARSIPMPLMTPPSASPASELPLRNQSLGLGSESHQFQLEHDVTEPPPMAFWENLLSSSPSASYDTTPLLNAGSSESEMDPDVGPSTRRASAPAETLRVFGGERERGRGRYGNRGRYEASRGHGGSLVVEPGEWLSGT